MQMKIINIHMKKIFFYAGLLLCFSFNAVAQQSLTFSDNSYQNADKQLFILANTNLNEGNAGINQVWDFSKLTPTGEQTSYMFDAKTFPMNVLYPESNVVLREGIMDFYFKVTPSGMAEYGNSTTSFSIVYDKPIVKFPFPFDLGSSISGTYSGKIISSTTSNIEGTYSTTADGYGTLLLPGNVKINDVLRVRFMRKNNNNTNEIITYRWYARNSDPIVRYPLLSLTKSENKGKSSITKIAYYANADQLMENQTTYLETENPKEFTSAKASKYEIKVSPNPFIDYAKIEYSLPNNSKVTVQAFDNLGRLAETLVDTDQPVGKYSLKFKGNGQFIYFIKFIINGEVISAKKLIQMK